MEFIEKYNTIVIIFEKMTGTPDILAVLAGFFWCAFGIFLRNLYEVNEKGITLKQSFSSSPKPEILIKVMVVIAAMRFFRFIFDTDTIALAGFFIGLSLDYLPRIIISIPKMLLERFDFKGFMRREIDKENRKEDEADGIEPEQDCPHPHFPHFPRDRNYNLEENTENNPSQFKQQEETLPENPPLEKLPMKKDMNDNKKIPNVRIDSLFRTPKK
jgi:hypothetical protein